VLAVAPRQGPSQVWTGESFWLDVMTGGAARGERRAFAALVTHYRVRLRRFLQAAAPNEPIDMLEASVWESSARGVRSLDLAQRRARAFDRDRGDGSRADQEPGFRGWLFALAREHLRALSPPLAGAPSRLLDRIDVEFMDLLDGAVGGGDAALAELIDGLGADERDVVLLRVVGAFDIDQVAAVLDRKVEWVRFVCGRALVHIADRYRPEEALVPVGVGSRTDVLLADDEGHGASSWIESEAAGAVLDGVVEEDAPLWRTDVARLASLARDPVGPSDARHLEVIVDGMMRIWRAEGGQ
jgi:hypothetical protein